MKTYLQAQKALANQCCPSPWSACHNLAQYPEVVHVVMDISDGDDPRKAWDARFQGLIPSEQILKALEEAAK